MSRYNILRLAIFIFLAGVAFASFLPFGLFEAYLLFLFGVLFVILGRHNTGMRMAGIAICIFTIGFGRAVFVSPEKNFPPQNTSFEFSGTVRMEPLYRGGIQTVTVAIANQGEHNGNGIMRMRIAPMPAFFQGDSISGTCDKLLPEWKSPQTGRVFPPLCIQSNIIATSADKISPGYIIGRSRRLFQNIIDRGLLPPASDLLGGLLLGAQQNFSETLKNDFRRAGVSHIVAVSGYNITVIIVGLWSVLRRTPLGRRRSFWALAFGVILFTALTGAGAATVRASVMGISVLFGQYLGRLSNSGHALLVAMAAMVAVNPSILLSSVGFQLSVLATAGLIYLSPLISFSVQKLPQLWGLKDVAVQTISATIATAPFIAGTFNTFSVVALPANMAIVPFIPFAMAFGFAWSVSALALHAFETVARVSLYWMSDILAFPVTIVLNGIVSAASFFASIPFAQIDVRVSSAILWTVVALFYGFMIAGIIIARKRLRLALQESSIMSIT